MGNTSWLTNSEATHIAVIMRDDVTAGTRSERNKIVSF